MIWFVLRLQLYVKSWASNVTSLFFIMNKTNHDLKTIFMFKRWFSGRKLWCFGNTKNNTIFRPHLSRRRLVRVGVVLAIVASILGIHCLLKPAVTWQSFIFKERLYCKLCKNTSLIYYLAMSPQDESRWSKNEKLFHWENGYGIIVATENHVRWCINGQVTHSGKISVIFSHVYRLF